MTRKLSETEIQAIVHAEITNADGISSSAVAGERGENMDYYQSQPFGNEIDGRSSVIYPTVMQTIEWVLPILLRIFTSGENVVSFQPQKPGDEQFAKIATDYVSFIWNDDNRGFLNFYSAFKDALLQKNGILKIWWDDSPSYKRERYNGLDDASYANLVNDDAVDVSEHTANEQQVPGWHPETGLPTAQDVTTHDLVLTREVPGGKVCVVPVPPEEFLISKEARDIDGARFVGHRKQVTLSDLKEEGVSDEILSRLAGDDGSTQTDSEAIKRNTVEDPSVGSSGALNKAMTLVWRTESFIKLDVDGDGIAEMRKVVTVGPESQIISNESWDADRPFVSITPIIMPHRFWGLALADIVKTFQKVSSTILRQYLDNLYLSNNQREEVVESRIVDPAAVLSSKPGVKIRVKEGNGPAISPIAIPQIGAQALEGMNYIDQMTENVTGASARTQGLGTDPLHDTA